MLKIGITTTVPVEIILAAGYTPVDLNNIFIMDNEPNKLVEAAETAGYPRNICGWIKGLYSVVLSPENNINKIIAVTQGDCSNTHALMETFRNVALLYLQSSTAHRHFHIAQLLPSNQHDPLSLFLPR